MPYSPTSLSVFVRACPRSSGSSVSSLQSQVSSLKSPKNRKFLLTIRPSVIYK